MHTQGGNASNPRIRDLYGALGYIHECKVEYTLGRLIQTFFNRMCIQSNANASVRSALVVHPHSYSRAKRALKNGYTESYVSWLRCVFNILEKEDGEMVKRVEFEESSACEMFVVREGLGRWVWRLVRIREKVGITCACTRYVSCDESCSRAFQLIGIDLFLGFKSLSAHGFGE